MIGIIIGLVLAGLGGFFWAKKNKKIGLTFMIIGGLVFAISGVASGIF